MHVCMHAPSRVGVEISEMRGRRSFVCRTGRSLFLR